MAGKNKKREPNPSQPAEFRTSPFASLKSVVVEEAPAKHPVQPIVPAPKTPKAEPDDSELFLQAVAGVSPLRRTTPSVTEKKTATVGRKLKTAADITVEPGSKADFLQEIERLQLDVKFEDKLPDEDELKPLGGNRLRMLKRGVVNLDRQIDLHGLTRDEAIESLEGFLRSARQAGEKAVLIITGKGIHSSDGPVLSQAVSAWLRDQGRSHISEFAPAPQEMGGSGALVVFLRPLDKPTDR